jgi:hypothetical protein
VTHFGDPVGIRRWFGGGRGSVPGLSQLSQLSHLSRYWGVGQGGQGGQMKINYRLYKSRIVADCPYIDKKSPDQVCLIRGVL